MELKSVTEDDAEFLFELLKQREGRVNISHKSTPDWEEHFQYVKNHDYQSFDIIWIDEHNRIVDIKTLNPNTETASYPKTKCKYIFIYLYFSSYI